MQNSGFGNTVNPLLSIADNDVYSIPMVLLIGWRGEPGEKDEPQHIKQGKVSEDLLVAMEIPYQIIDENSDVDTVIDKAMKIAISQKKPYALLVRNNTFEKYTLLKESKTYFPLNREGAIKLIIDQLNEKRHIPLNNIKDDQATFEVKSNS